MKLLTIALTLFCAAPSFAAQKIITFKNAFGAAEQARLVESRGGRIVKDFPFINAVLADFPDGRAAGLDRAPGVASAEDDEEIYWLASEERPFTLEEAAARALQLLAGEPGQPVPPGVSTPPAVSTQAPVAPVYIATTSVEGKVDHMPWSLGRIQAPQAWAFTKGKGVRVAVLDTGADCAHMDLAAACGAGYNALAPGKPPADDKGHGTHVSGIIAGALNWKGMVGVAPEATILPVKVLNSSGSGKVSDIIDGINWAVKNRADVINMSLGAPKYSEAQGKAVKAARQAGIFVVCAAGNDSGPVNYPGAYPEAVAVAAMDYANKTAAFSSRGPEVDFIAPGVRIFSAFPNGAFNLISGTSQAAPHVSGMAALAISLGVKGPDAIKAALEKASADLGLPREEQGAGAPVASLLVNNILSGRP